MTRVLFVCTGNIFRSLSAEYAMKNILPADSDIRVSSAGTIARVEPIHPDTLARLAHHGIDPSAHVQRRVSAEILNDADLVIAMNTDHRAFLAETFGCPSTLFFEAATGEARPFPDLCDVYPDWRSRPEASRAYIHQAVDSIIDAAAKIVARLEELKVG